MRSSLMIMTPFIQWFCVIYCSSFVNIVHSSNTSETSDLHELKSQIDSLIVQRQDDYNRLEMIIRNSLNKNAEIDQLRNEIKELRMELDSTKSKNCIGGGMEGNRIKNEQLTVEWLSNSITEIRTEMTELAKSFNSSATLQQRQSFSTDISILQNDVVSLRHDMEYLKTDLAKFNAKLAVFTQDIDTLKQSTSNTAAKVTNFTEQIQIFSYDWSKVMKMLVKKKHRTFKKMVVVNENPLEMEVYTVHHRDTRTINNNEDETDVTYNKKFSGYGNHGHKKRKRHYNKFSDVSVALSNLRKYLEERILKIENQLLSTPSPLMVNQNSRSIYDDLTTTLSNLEKRMDKLEIFVDEAMVHIKGQDKLHSSILELLESVENLETKFDSVTTVMKKEISKLDFSFSQVTFNLSVIQEHQEDEKTFVKTMNENFSKTEARLDQYENKLSSVSEKLDNAAISLDLYSNIFDQNLTKSMLEDVDKNSLLNARVDVEASKLSIPLYQLYAFHNEYSVFLRQLPKDCNEVKGASGVYLISIDEKTSPILVYCEKSSSNSYIVIQRRTNGETDFNKNWEEYTKGFGDFQGEFWLGNEIIHRLTKENDTSLRIEFEDITGKQWYAEYSTFSVASRHQGYRLHVDGFSGNTSNALEYQNLMQFSTTDSDHDTSDTNCAANYEGGWWFSHCQHTNLNGKYNLGLTWFDSSRNEWIAVSSSKIMLTKRRKYQQHG